MPWQDPSLCCVSISLSLLWEEVLGENEKGSPVYAAESIRQDCACKADSLPFGLRFFLYNFLPQKFLTLQNQCKPQNRSKRNEVPGQRQACKMKKTRIDLQGAKFFGKGLKMVDSERWTARVLPRTQAENGRFKAAIQQCGL